MNPGTQDSLGTILLRYNLIHEDDLREALEEQKRTQGRLGETLVRMGYLKEDVLTWCLANQLNIPCVSAIDTRPDRLDLEALNRLPAALAYAHHAIPLLFAGNELTLVTDDPLDRAGLEEIERATGLRLNVAAGPTSEILRALAELYGPDPQSGADIDLDFEPEGMSGASDLDTLEAWLARTRAAGHRRFILESHGSGGQLRLRARGNPGPPQLIDSETFRALMSGLQEVCGVPRVVEPVLRPFSLGVHQGTVAFGLGAGGPVAAVVLEEVLDTLHWPSAWSSPLRSGLKGPGLWLLGVHSSRLWKPLVRAMTGSLEPERRVLTPGEGWLAGPAGDRYAITPEALEGLLGLEPDVLILPAQARGAVIEHLRAGLPDAAILLQVAARTPLRALQILRGSGITGPEMAEVVRGVLCVNTLEQRCAECRSRALEAPMKLAVGGEAQLEPAVEGSSGCALCHDTGVWGEVPILSWYELGEELEAALAEEEPISSLKAHLVPGPVPYPSEQVQAYLEQERISARTAEAWMTT